MVLLFLTEVALETGWWAIKHSYNLGYYMIYGKEESKEEKILKQIEELKKDLEKEREELHKHIDMETYMKYKKIIENQKLEPIKINTNLYEKLNELEE